MNIVVIQGRQPKQDSASRLIQHFEQSFNRMTGFAGGILCCHQIWRAVPERQTGTHGEKRACPGARHDPWATPQPAQVVYKVMLLYHNELLV